MPLVVGATAPRLPTASADSALDSKALVHSITAVRLHPTHVEMPSGAAIPGTPVCSLKSATETPAVRYAFESSLVT